jgi:hypothetical protein
MRRVLRLLPWLVLLGLFLAFGWVVGLIALVILAVRSIVRFRRARAAVAEVTFCPRGHRVPQYGVYRCGQCGASSESSAWVCPVCHAESGWVACPTCSLAVTNPLTR